MSVRSRLARGNPCCNIVMPVPVSANIIHTIEPPIPFHCLYEQMYQPEYSYDYPPPYPPM